MAKEIAIITDGNGSSVTIDTTGNMDLIRAGMEFTGSRGQLIFVGVPPPDALLNVHIITFLQACIAHQCCSSAILINLDRQNDPG